MNAPSSMPSGWFPDPHGRYEHRWFNGHAWTADVADDGRRFVDPLGAAPARLGAPSGATGVQPGNGPATAAITLGMLGLLFAWMPFLVVVGLVLAVLAIVFGVRGRRRAAVGGSGGGMARAGILTGAGGVALSIVGFFLTAQATEEFTDFIRPGAHDAVLDECVIDGGTVTLTGSITNRSTSTRDYTVYGVVTQPRRVADIVLNVTDVEPGETRPVELSEATDREGECTARFVVHGPLPYGVDMERVNE